MADKEQNVEELKAKLAAAEEALEQSRSTVKAQTSQIEDLRTGLAMGDTSKLPKEVQADYRDRLAAGLPPHVALERAMHQHRHNAARKAELTDDQQDEVDKLVKGGVGTALAVTRVAHAAHVEAFKKSQSTQPTEKTAKAR